MKLLSHSKNCFLLSPVAPALLALLTVLPATSADFDLAFEPPPVGVAAADLGRADREEEENDATAIVAISGHFRQSERDPFHPFQAPASSPPQDSRFIGDAFHFIFFHALRSFLTLRFWDLTSISLSIVLPSVLVAGFLSGEVTQTLKDEMLALRKSRQVAF